MAKGYSGAFGVPYQYDYRNVYSAARNPSTMHANDTGLTWFFMRYLTEKVLSVFEFKGIPETWSKDYFLYTLFLWGNIAVIETDKYGVIPQHCGLAGYDVFYRPTTAIISNPLLKGILRPRIGVECSLIKMQPDYGGCFDLIMYYAEQLAVASESLGVNMVNSKLAYVFAVRNKATAEGFKKMFDKIASGEPAVFADSKLFKDGDGSVNWDTFAQNLQQNYLADRILIDMAKIDNRFDTEIGIANVNITKTSGVSNSEITANNNATESKARLWLDTIRDGLKQTNDLFGLDLSVDLRFKQEAQANDQGSVGVDTWAVPSR